MWSRLKFFLNPIDARFEDLRKGRVELNIVRDFTAGLIVAMVAIPLAMGFAMASGLRPEQGIIGGAIAGVVGALFGGSKYQVYGPTAAFIPVIAAVMLVHDHGFLVLAGLVAAAMLAIMGLTGLGKIVNKVPHSIVVGFTIGIAITIGLSQIGPALGYRTDIGYKFFDKLHGLWVHREQIAPWPVALAIGTLVLTRSLLKTSVYIPAPLIALGVCAILGASLLSHADLVLIGTVYGEIPAEMWAFTPPAIENVNAAWVGDLIYYALAIAFVCAIESLLCSRMADRLAENKGTPFNPDKELWGQAMVLTFVPLFNGFPHTGALARTATNIKLGAVSPLAGIFKAGLKILIAYYLASYLELVPMACIAGILLYVAMNMVKPGEIPEVRRMGRAHTLLMVYTAVAVVVTDFLTGVVSALVIYGALRWGFPKDAHAAAPAREQEHKKLPPRAEIAAHSNGAAKAPAESAEWLSNIQGRAHVARSAYVHPSAVIIGRVVLGNDVHIAAGASVRADEGSPFFIGSDSNVQDGVVMHALRDRYVRVHDKDWAIYVGERVSMAHDALIHGPCFVGDDSFIGFKAVVHDAVVGPRCFVGIGAVVVGVNVPEGRFVPHGTIVDTQSKADALGSAAEQHREFNADVVEVNRGLAAAYREHALASIADGPLVARVDKSSSLRF